MYKELDIAPEVDEAEIEGEEKDPVEMAFKRKEVLKMAVKHGERAKFADDLDHKIVGQEISRELLDDEGEEIDQSDQGYLGHKGHQGHQTPETPEAREEMQNEELGTKDKFEKDVNALMQMEENILKHIGGMKPVQGVQMSQYDRFGMPKDTADYSKYIAVYIYYIYIYIYIERRYYAW